MRIEFPPGYKGTRKREIPFVKEYETFSPEGVKIQGILSERISMVDAKIGFLERGTERKIRFMVDSGSPITILRLEDAKHLLKRSIPQNRGQIRSVDGTTRAEGTYLNTEVWFEGERSQRDILVEMKSRVFVLDRPFGDRPSLLGCDILMHFESQIDFVKGKVVFTAKNSDGMRAFRKIA